MTSATVNPWQQVGVSALMVTAKPPKNGAPQEAPVPEKVA